MPSSIPTRWALIAYVFVGLHTANALYHRDSGRECRAAPWVYTILGAAWPATAIGMMFATLLDSRVAAEDWRKMYCER